MVNIGFEMFTEVKARFDLMECYHPIKLQRLEGQNRIDVADLWGAKGSLYSQKNGSYYEFRELVRPFVVKNKRL